MTDFGASVRIPVSPLPQHAPFRGDQQSKPELGLKCLPGVEVQGASPRFLITTLTPGLPSSKKSEKILSVFTLTMNFTPQFKWGMSFTNGQDESQFGTQLTNAGTSPFSNMCSK